MSDDQALGYIAQMQAVITAPAPMPVPTPTTGPSGIAIPAEPAGWRRIFVDNFDYDVPLGQFRSGQSWQKWSSYPEGWPDTRAKKGVKGGTYSSNKTLSVHSSVLDIYLHTEGGYHYVANPFPRLIDPSIMQIAGGSDFYYYAPALRVEFVYRFAKIPGYKTAWLFWPHSGSNSANGEIDLPEGDLDGVAKTMGFMHRAGGGQDYWNTGHVHADGLWHRGAIEWRKGVSCQFFSDGVAHPPWTTNVPNDVMRGLQLQSETILDTTKPVPDTSAGHLEIDWLTAAVPA